MKSAEIKYNARRRHWLMSDDGVRKVFESVNEIFSLIEKRISENALIFETLRIEMENKSRFLRSAANNEFGCQVRLTGFLKYSHNHLINLRLEIILFSKTPTRRKEIFDANCISGFSLKADLTSDDQVIWRDEIFPSKSLTAEAVCEKMFGLLMDQTDKNPQLNRP